MESTEVVARKCSVKKAFLEISQNSQENTYARASFLIKLQVSSSIFRILLPLRNPLVASFNETRAPTSRKYVLEQGLPTSN